MSQPFGDLNTLKRVALEPDKVRLLLEKDEEFFIQFFMGDELTWPVPEFHKDIFHLMTDITIERLAIAVPRDHAKTTLAKLAALWYFLFTPYSFIVYLSATSTIACNACTDIIGFLDNPNFQSIFGIVSFDIKREGEGFYKFKIWVYDEDGKLKEKTCILKALGAQQQVRGLNIEHRRPQVAIIDDLEDADIINTKDLFEKLKKWFFGSFRKALDKSGHKLIQIGNMTSDICLLKENCESNFWHAVRYGCILSNGEILWPDAFSLEKLRSDFAEYLERGQIHTWFAEMMNLPIVGGKGLIKASEITYKPYVYPGDGKYGFITVDPAISKKKWAHKAAVSVHLFVEDSWQIVTYHQEVGMDPLQLFTKIVELAKVWNVHIIGVENTAYQASLQFVFPYFAVVQGIRGLRFVPLVSTLERKPQRFAGWCAMLKAGQYAINEGDFTITQQILSFDPKKQDQDVDLLDCCSYGDQMITMYLPEIMETIDPLPNEGGLVDSIEVENMSG